MKFKYLDEGDMIDENTFYLNRLGEWQPAKMIGLKISYSDFGRYARFG